MAEQLSLRIGKTYTFEAAHHLERHDGKCRSPHGHSYKLHIEVQGSRIAQGPKSGMVIDYHDLDTLANLAILDRLDHHDLNVELPELGGNTTAESLALWCFAEIDRVLNAWLRGTREENEYKKQVNHAPQYCALRRVRIQETAKSWAEVVRD